MINYFIVVFLALTALVVVAPETNVDKKTGVYIVSKGLVGIGSAFKVDDNKLVTANHVCQALGDTSKVMVETKDESVLVESVHMYPDNNVDVCVLVTNKPLEGYTFELSKTKPGLYERLTVMGYPKATYPIKVGNVRVITSEYISEPFYFMNQTLYSEYFIRTTGELIPGQSGGPTLNRVGEVVGINARVLIGGNVSFFAPILKVREFIYDI